MIHLQCPEIGIFMGFSRPEIGKNAGLLGSEWIHEIGYNPNWNISALVPGIFCGTVKNSSQYHSHIYSMSMTPNVYPLVNVYITMENHHAINGKIHYFNGHFQ